MCGFAGIIDDSLNTTNMIEIIQNMTMSLSHRGPDSTGIWVSGNVALGHRRLIVVDPLGGSQPMIISIGDKTWILLYNGELYNTKQLRDRLITHGHKFSSRSDTEVVLRSFIQWGEHCAELFNGIFAIAVYEQHNNAVTLIRDNMGVKPLFYCQTKDSFIFASEIKAILKNPKIKPELNRNGLQEILALSPARTPGCGVFKGINEVLPAQIIRIKDSFLHKKIYWRPTYKEHNENTSDTAHHLKQLVTDAITRQNISDVPLGTFLSGGLDSSVISAITADVQRERGRQLKTFSINFKGNDVYFKPSLFQPDSDEFWAKRVANLIGSNHREMMFTSRQLVDALCESMHMRDLPGMADIDSSLLLFCREVKKDLTVALSGEVADELLGGYPWFHHPEIAGEGTFPWASDMTLRKEILADSLKDSLDIEGYAREKCRQTMDEVQGIEYLSQAERFRRKLFWLNMRWFMLNLLERKDRMSMASGLEVRVPYCDRELVDYIWNIPWDIKCAKDREKGILRLAMEDLLPEDVIWRKKSPYPKTFNPKYANMVTDMLKDELSMPNPPVFDLLNKKEIEKLMINPSAITKPFFGQLMAGPQLLAWVVQLNMWLKEYSISLV